MSTIGWIIVAIAVVVVVALVLILRSLRGSRMRQRAARASAMRREAQAKAPDIAASRQQLGDAETQAAAARMQAEKAERDAASARDALAHDEASQEDLLREADRLDPSVNHRAGDYRPTPPVTGGAHAAPAVEEGTNDAEPTGGSGGAHASRL